MTETLSKSSLDYLKDSVKPIREKLAANKIYQAIKEIDDLQIFMEHYVFAVWDFMSLLKAMQIEHTCVSIPWNPSGNAVVRRYINDLVLGLESAQLPNGSVGSHFELYVKAMEQWGANTAPINEFIRRTTIGESVEKALSDSDVPPASQRFVANTWHTIINAEPHQIAASFLFGRESIIPDSFINMIEQINEGNNKEDDILVGYLKLNNQEEQDIRKPVADLLLTELCGNDEKKWEEAKAAVVNALEHRIEFWNSIHKHILLKK